MNHDAKKLHPVVPLRDIVIFPHMIVPIFVGRDASVSALDEAISSSQKEIILVLQQNSEPEHPEDKDLSRVGVMGNLLQVLRLPDNTIKLLVQGGKRVRIDSFDFSQKYIQAECTEMEESLRQDDELDPLMKACINAFESYTKNNRKIPSEVFENLVKLEDPSRVADTIASYFSLKLHEKQTLLEITDINERLEKILLFIESESTIANVEKRIRNRVKKQMEKTQRDYYLNEQMKAIYKELGDNNEGREDIAELEAKRKKTDLSPEASKKYDSELKKIKLMHPSSAESAIIRNYLDWLLSIPWTNSSKIEKNINKAEEKLNKDHFGLDKVKERILEFLAVQNRVKEIKSQILCLVGPPGVGKTSLGKSIADATGREFIRISLGGVKDEAEIRGHRRTYMGSMPGKIIQAMKKASTKNPLFLLDEIDKLGQDWRGDPASALLEVLDPEQNATFNDHYLEIDYDLSNVMFVTTSNSYNMPQPLLDRLELIQLSGYSETEKLGIAKNHLIPKQLKNHGLKDEELHFSDDAIIEIIRRYTKEAGVRNLEREISKVCRKIVRKLSVDKKINHEILTQSNLEPYLSIPKYSYGEIDENHQVGVTTGLAWTELGGDILSIEALLYPGKGNLKLTGKLGDVMQESAQAALSYIKSRAHEYGLKASDFEKKDIHIHVPAGGIPKDGPSAGIALSTSIVSAFTNIPVLKDVAMTGEITLRGKVLPIGGLKEKLMAAQRAGIKTVVIPYDNEKDLHEVSSEVKDSLKIIPVKSFSEVVVIALTELPKIISMDESNDLELYRSMQTNPIHSKSNFQEVSPVIN